MNFPEPGPYNDIKPALYMTVLGLIETRVLRFMREWFLQTRSLNVPWVDTWRDSGPVPWNQQSKVYIFGGDLNLPAKAFKPKLEYCSGSPTSKHFSGIDFKHIRVPRLLLLLKRTKICMRSFLGTMHACRTNPLSYRTHDHRQRSYPSSDPKIIPRSLHHLFLL